MIDSSLNGIRVTLLITGLLSLAVSSTISRAAGRRGGEWPSRVRAVGGVGAVVGWLLFVGLPRFEGGLNAPVLLILAASYPLIAVERGRGLALRLFTWSALAFLVAGCAASADLPLGWRSIQLQDSLLFLGLVAPPVVAALAWAYGRLGARGS